MNISKALLIALLLPAPFPQSSDSQPRVSEELVMVSLPEEVILPGTTIPAGEYHIRLGAKDNRPMLLFTSSSQADREVPVSIVPTPSGQPSDSTEVILERVGTSVYLTGIWLQARTTGYDL